MPDSPAEKAGIEPGDVIRHFAGQEVDDPGDLGLAVGRMKAGSEATVGLTRDGREIKVTVEVGERPAQME